MFNGIPICTVFVLGVLKVSFGGVANGPDMKIIHSTVTESGLNTFLMGRCMDERKRSLIGRYIE
jgi:hypothetical protein